jgi:RNA polymerase sigma-70 factor (ECF subfamily)
MTPTKVTDEQLLDRAEESALVLQAKAGDFDAFDQLVRRCEKRVWTVAWRLLATREDTENVVQSAFIKALESLESFRGESSFCTWVGRIANRKALDVLRKRKREKTSSLDELTTDDDFTPIAHPELLVDWREDPARGVEREELRSILDASLAKLPMNLRAIFVLRDVDGMDTAQAAGELGISVANAKVRLLRARLRLREELTRAFGGEAMVHHHLEPAGLGGLASAMERLP